MKYFLVLFFSVFLIARENPFIPSGEMDEDKIKATNIKPLIEDFEKKRINLPNSARILKYITIGYQTIDGSIKEKKVLVNENIDWHDDLILSVKDIAPIPTIVPVQEVEIQDSIKKGKITEKIVIKEDLKVDKKPKKVKKKKLFSFNLKSYFDFDIQGKTLTLHVKDRLLRDFLVSKPYKLVFDFKKKSAFYTKTLKINKPPFTSVTIGAHDSFYRTSFLLDGPYGYDLKKEVGKIVIKLK